MTFRPGTCARSRAKAVRPSASGARVGALVALLLACQACEGRVTSEDGSRAGSGGAQGGPSGTGGAPSTCFGAEPAVCGGACVDLATDPQHCGACGVACSPGAVCKSGTCAAGVSGSCGDGKMQAGEACDGADLGGKDCTAFGFGKAGALACNATCGGFDTSGCGSKAKVGDECASDASCGPGGTCFGPLDDVVAFGGGPAGGYCSTDCIVAADCPAGSICLMDAGGTSGVCVLACELGPELQYMNDPLDPDKCHGRLDVGCTDVGVGSPVCMPLCGSDKQCAGRLCDPRLSVCVDTLSTGLEQGSKCDPGAPEPECAGSCIEFEPGTTACAIACVLGGEDIVNSANCGGITGGICTWTTDVSEGYGAGDGGYCAPACLVHSDCQNPTFFCYAIGNLTGSIIENGFCFGSTPCPNGIEDCVWEGSPTGDECVETKYGLYCVDPVFPLGDAALGGGGG